jgi:membrane associated rhomboid family serine protease
MLSDRKYMRDVRTGFGFEPVPWLMGIFAALFLLQHVVEKWFGVSSHYDWFGLSAGAVVHGRRWWTLVTYNFLQDTAGYTGGVFALIFNLLGLYFFGGAVRSLVSPRRFTALYFGFVAVGALAWCAAYALRVDWMLYGPSVSLAGLFALYCCYHANEDMTFLAFFIIPVTVKPKYFCWCWVALDLVGFLFYEMMGRPSPLWVGHIANLTVMLTAYGYYRIASREDRSSSLSFAGFGLPRWLRRRPKTTTPHFQVNITNRDHLRAEVDRILDKINSEGFGALTEDEKRRLDEARDLLSRR